MSNCGQPTRNGGKCKRKAGWGTKANNGRCRDHAVEADAKRQGLKKQFVAALEKGTNSMRAIARWLGYDQSTVWHWRQADAEFDKAVFKAQTTADGLRVTMVEDSLFKRLVSGKATGLELVFFLANRAPHRWRHVQRMEHTGVGGGPIQTEDVTRIREELKTKLRVIQGGKA